MRMRFALFAVLFGLLIATSVTSMADQSPSPQPTQSSAPTFGIPNSNPLIPTGPPVQIESCGVYRSGNAVLAQSGNLQIKFTNEGTQPVTAIRFRVLFGDNGGFYVRDVGNFAPGVEVTHTYRQGGGIYFSPLFSPLKMSCDVAAIQFADGTVWTPPTSTQQQPLAKTASPTTLPLTTPAEVQQIPAAAQATSLGSIQVPAGDLISVKILGDIGSRISNEGDTFAVVTVEDYYVHGKLVLPKGSPGYGEITHVKRAGMWHAGGELKFTVKKLVAPDGTTLPVETNGATADADKNTEHNGNEAGQYILWGPFGIFTHRGNDILIKDGSYFHVAVSDLKEMPAIPWGARPASINWDLVTVHPTQPQSSVIPPQQ